MAEETLLTAARRVVRFFRIDNETHGGLISIETTAAVETLERQVQVEVHREQTRQTLAEMSRLPNAGEGK